MKNLFLAVVLVFAFLPSYAVADSPCVELVKKVQGKKKQSRGIASPQFESAEKYIDSFLRSSKSAKKDLRAVPRYFLKAFREVAVSKKLRHDDVVLFVAHVIKFSKGEKNTEKLSIKKMLEDPSCQLWGNNLSKK